MFYINIYNDGHVCNILGSGFLLGLNDPSDQASMVDGQVLFVEDANGWPHEGVAYGPVVVCVCYPIILSKHTYFLSIYIYA